MEERAIGESRTEKALRMGDRSHINDRSDINWRLSKVPVELHLAVNRIALGLAGTLGWKCAADLDFVNSDELRANRFARLALVAMGELQEFCLDEWGTSLQDLVKTEDDE